LSAAKQADAVFYFGGLDHDQDVEDKDRVDMKLPGNQDRVIAELVDVNPNTVVLLVAGSPVEMPWVEGTRALIWGGYAGMHAGDAFARVIFGEVNPSGKLPFTLPATLSDSAPIALDDYNAEQALYKEGVFVGYRWFEKNNIKPNFAFGHGLSYSTFALSDLRIPAVFDNANGKITVAVTIKNTGKVAGAEVVQLYLGDEQASVPRPVRELKGFQKVSLQPGEVKTLNFDLQLRDLSFWDVNTHNWLAEAGVFNVYLGASSDDIRLQGQFNYQPVNYQP
jgi:beta-glucosidase